MNAVEIEQAISDLADQPYDAAEFPFAFLECFDNSAARSTKLRKGASNKSHMGRSKSPRQAQRLFAAHDQINTIFKPCRYRLTSISYRHARADAFSLWADYAAKMEAWNPQTRSITSKP